MAVLVGVLSLVLAAGCWLRRADDAAADWLFLLPNLVITRADITGVAENATGLSFDLSQVARR